MSAGIAARLRRGREIIREEYKSQDASKLGILRAGNSGVMSPDGQVAGSCHRVAHLRQLGIELDPPTDNTLIMFQLGTANEDVIYNDLKQTSNPSEVILRETDIPTSWMTSNGTPVTGRPDMVLCAKGHMVDEKSGASQEITFPAHLIEIKSIASVWTTKEVVMEGRPKIAHLAQAGHYMWQLGVPGTLLYKQYAIQQIPDFAQRLFPRKGQPGSEHIEYEDKKVTNKTTGQAYMQSTIKSIKPLEVAYDLRFSSPDLAAPLQYSREGADQWFDTIVTRADIRAFYEYVSKMSTDKVLGPKPLTVSPNGEEKSYSNCKYCVLNTICNGKLNKKLSYDDWLSMVKSQLSKGAT